MTPLSMKILVLGVEDYTPLWDALFEVREAHPSLDLPAARTLATQILWDLAQAHEIEIYAATKTLGEAAPTRMDHVDWDRILQDPENWEVPMPGAPRVNYYFAATDHGCSQALAAHFGDG